MTDLIILLLSDEFVFDEFFIGLKLNDLRKYERLVKIAMRKARSFHCSRDTCLLLYQFYECILDRTSIYA